AAAGWSRAAAGSWLARRPRDAGGVDDAAPDGELYPRQRPWRRAGDGSPRAEVEEPLMTGTANHPLPGIGDDRAGEMGALLPVGEERPVPLSDQEAGILLTGIGEGEDLTRLQVAQRHQAPEGELSP